MASQKNIKLVKGIRSEALSPDQEKFNRLVKQISILKEQLAASESFHVESKKIYVEQIRPLNLQLIELQKQFVIELDACPLIEKLSPRQKENLTAIICGELDMLNEAEVEGIDELLEKYFPEDEEEMSEEEKVEEEMAKIMFAKMFKDSTGIEIDVENIQSMEDFERQVIEKLEEKERIRAEKKAKRKKSKAEIEKEQNYKAEEEKLNQSTKELYIELVKNFHPDQEMDPDTRAWKTQIMQELTVAYDENNLLKLLELQLTFLEGKDTALQTLPDEKLKYYNKILQEQKRELTAKLYDINEIGLPGVSFNGKVSQSLRTLQLNSTIVELNKGIADYNAMRLQLTSLKGLKELIKKRREEYVN